MSVHLLPTPLAQRTIGAPPALSSPTPANPRNRTTCGVFEVAGRLGLADRAVPHICRTLDALIAREAFPAPFPLYRAGQLVRGAHRDSCWPRVAVDAWFDDRLPPNARGQLDQAERAEIDSRLSANAAKLFGLGDAA